MRFFLEPKSSGIGKIGGEMAISASREVYFSPIPGMRLQKEPMDGYMAYCMHILQTFLEFFNSYGPCGFSKGFEFRMLEATFMRTVR